ncbi:MAG: DUF4446 family protein [Candidatus Nealsonbacteria bacterium]|nr:DUF4446 family protein [Candidatus Nealsonbacteria bacterium]
MINLFNKTKKEPADLEGVLGYLKKLEEKHEELSRELAEFKEKSRKDLQKIGMVRYNPFQETGGEQSFSIAVLDGNNNGFVITSHYYREANRVYAKPIEQGKSKYQLSKEEEAAINKAINGQP